MPAKNNSGSTVRHWLDDAAAEVVTTILRATSNAPANVREAIPQPSQLDLAIVARVADLLGPHIARLSA